MRWKQKIELTLEYSIHFTRDLFGARNDLLEDVLAGRRPKVAVFLDSGVHRSQPGILRRIETWFDRRGTIQAFPVCIVPGGEHCKDGFEWFHKIAGMLREYQLDRHSYVVAIGGGSVLDVVGFCAAVSHRGIRHIRVPTTVLSQSDSGIGVKNGVNFFGAKNFFGAFTPPFAVINDSTFLNSLSDRDWISGMSEAFKVAIIKDGGFLAFLRKNAAALRRRDVRLMEQLIERSAKLHADHICEGGDPFELGSARPLDFGHWSAHCMESLSHYAIQHGEAVAIGVVIDLTIAKNRGLISVGEYREVADAFLALGFPVWHPIIEERGSDGRLIIYQGVEEFRQHLGGDLTLIMPLGLGSSASTYPFTYAEVELAINEIGQRPKDKSVPDEAGKREPFDVLPQYSSG